MGIENLIGKTLSAAKTISDKVNENDKGFIEFWTSLGQTINDLTASKDKFEKKFSDYELELDKAKKKLRIIFTSMLVLQTVTFIMVLVLAIK